LRGKSDPCFADNSFMVLAGKNLGNEFVRMPSLAIATILTIGLIVLNVRSASVPGFHCFVPLNSSRTS